MKTQTLDVELSPVDNRALANLCGALDANLRQIESALDVSIARRGAAFTVRGQPAQTQQAASPPQTIAGGLEPSQGSKLDRVGRRRLRRRRPSREAWNPPRVPN